MDLQLYLVVLGLFVLLLIASLLQPAARRLNFPFTVLLAAAGVLLGGGMGDGVQDGDAGRGSGHATINLEEVSWGRRRNTA